MRPIYIVLYILAAVCFLLAQKPWPTPRINLIALGLLLWVLVPLIQEVKAH